jgi:hypothetical protein
MLKRLAIFLIDLVITAVIALMLLGAVTAVQYATGWGEISIPDIPEFEPQGDWLDEVRPEMGNN